MVESDSRVVHRSDAGDGVIRLPRSQCIAAERESGGQPPTPMPTPTSGTTASTPETRPDAVELCACGTSGGARVTRYKQTLRDLDRAESEEQAQLKELREKELREKELEHIEEQFNILMKFGNIRREILKRQSKIKVEELQVLAKMAGLGSLRQAQPRKLKTDVPDRYLVKLRELKASGKVEELYLFKLHELASGKVEEELVSKEADLTFLATAERSPPAGL